MWGRASAGIVAGFLLAAGLIGLIGWLLPGAWQNSLVPMLVLFFPLWTAVACAAFLFADGKRAWAWLGTAALLALGLLWLLRTAGWIS